MIVAAWCLAMVIQFEGASEPTLSQIAIADVVMTRAHWQPKRVCREAFRPWQFTALMSKRNVPSEKSKSWKKSRLIAARVLKCGKRCDVTKGADHYYIKGTHQTKTFKIVSGSPYWSDSCVTTALYGTQVYCRERRRRSIEHANVATVPLNLPMIEVKHDRIQPRYFGVPLASINLVMWSAIASSFP